MTERANWIERAALAVSSVFLAVLFALLLTDVILRWLRIEFYWGSEGGGPLMAWLIVLALPMVIRRRTNIATDFMVSALPARWAAALSIVGGLLMLAYLGILTWKCAELTYGAWLRGTRAQGILRLPVFYVNAGIVLGLGLMILTQLLMVLGEIRALLKGGDRAK